MQQEIIADLRSRRVRYIVLVGVVGPVEPNESSTSSGATDLDDYIRDHYAPVRHFGSYLILQVRD